MIDYSAAKKKIEAMYRGRCTIYEVQGTPDATTKITKLAPAAVVSNQPCSLSYQNLSAVSDSAPGKMITQTIKLFLAPEITVKPGSKITVVQNGVTGSYVSSGLPAVYPTHQEVILEAGGWA